MCDYNRSLFVNVLLLQLAFTVITLTVQYQFKICVALRIEKIQIPTVPREIVVHKKTPIFIRFLLFCVMMLLALHLIVCNDHFLNQCEVSRELPTLFSAVDWFVSLCLNVYTNTTNVAYSI